MKARAKEFHIIQKYGLASDEFSPYPKLKNILIKDDNRLKRYKELELTKQKSVEAPSSKILRLFTNLKVLDLSINRICRFNPNILLAGCKNLEVLKLDSNKILNLDDLQELGDMPHLSELTFLDNPISNDRLFIQILDKLIL